MLTPRTEYINAAATLSRLSVALTVIVCCVDSGLLPTKTVEPKAKVYPCKRPIKIIYNNLRAFWEKKNI